jgi:hypothetical protein
MIRANFWMKLLVIGLLTAVPAFPQPDRLPATDAEKIADALRAGPAFITKNATVLDWPSPPSGQYRLLRKGSNEWRLPYTVLRDAIFTHPTMAEGLVFLLASVPQKRCSSQPRLFRAKTRVFKPSRLASGEG